MIDIRPIGEILYEKLVDGDLALFWKLSVDRYGLDPYYLDEMQEYATDYRLDLRPVHNLRQRISHHDYVLRDITWWEGVTRERWTSEKKAASALEEGKRLAFQWKCEHFENLKKIYILEEERDNLPLELVGLVQTMLMG
jgi:hypothetical protein